MMNKIVKQVFKEINSIINKSIVNKNFIPCGRDPCYCLKYLDLSDIQNEKYYGSCYRSWAFLEDRKN